MQAKRNKTLAQEERLRAGDLDKGDGKKPLPIVRVGSETHAKDLVRIGDLLKELDVETILGRSRGTDPEINAQKEELVALRAQMEILKAPRGESAPAQPMMEPSSPANQALDLVEASEGISTTFGQGGEVIAATGSGGVPIKVGGKGNLNLPSKEPASAVMIGGIPQLKEMFGGKS